MWSGQTIVIDRNVRGKVQILAPEPLPRAEALERFHATLAQLGLGESTHHGVTIIAPTRLLSPQLEDRREALTTPQLPPTKDLVRMDYAAPTSIRDVVRDVARWSRRTFVIDRSVNGTISIFSPRPMSKERAYATFLSALDLLGLTETERGAAVQIVPIAAQAHQRPLRLDLPPSDSLTSGRVPMHYEHPTSIRTILADARSWYDHDLILDREVSGQVEILAPARLDRMSAYETLVAALDILGLGMVEEGGAVAIRPLRSMGE
jgi:hypothetical protein